jgi:MoxR-like ATPase
MSGRADLARILDRTTANDAGEVEPVLDSARIISHQKLVRQVAIAPHVRDFAVRLVLATHAGPVGKAGLDAAESFSTPMVRQYVRLGASPRAAQTLVLAGKCRALVDGRAAVSIDDLRAVAPASLRHRLIMNFEASAEGVTPDDVVANLVRTLPVDAPGVPA